jgi:hypothetical protein
MLSECIVSTFIHII